MNRFNENIKYFQGMFYSNNSKIGRNSFTTLEGKADESKSKFLIDDYQILNLENTDDDSFAHEAKLTSKKYF